jgi:hypothetical protein
MTYTNATDEEMKQFNKAKEQKYGQNQEDNNQITNEMICLVLVDPQKTMILLAHYHHYD